MSRSFRFKQFEIKQANSAMKLSTDSVLLGAWAECNNPKTILDIGTGTGILALMMAQRFPKAIIYAIEIDKPSYLDALKNFSASPWKNRLKAILGDIRTYNFDINFDCIISNPPYYQNSKPPNYSNKAQARHDKTLNFQDLAHITQKLLNNNGQANFIIANSQAKNFELTMSYEYLFCNKKTEVFTTDRKKTPELVLYNFLKKITGCNKQKFYIRKTKFFTEEYKKLTAPFYLFF